MADDAVRRLRERKLRILVTNDDGIAATGLGLLERVARGLSDDVWVVAPETNQSGSSHSLTMRRPLRIREVGERRFAIDGTPTDCVMLALQAVIKGPPVELVLSGVNHGGNLGEDVTYSGTVAAAMEATLFNVPAIALSQACTNGKRVEWETAERYASEAIPRLVSDGWLPDLLININFPDCPPDQVKGFKITAQGKRKLGDELLERIDPRGEPYVWIGGLRVDDAFQEGTDLHAAAAGYVSITPIHMDMTHRASFERLRASFEQVAPAAAPGVDAG